MRSAVIVSTARTPIGKAYRGAFNDTQAQALGGHVIAEAVKRAGVDKGEIEDVVMGAAIQQGSTYMNTARQCAMRAGLPTSVAGMSVDRQCASGLMAIATAAKQIIDDGMTVTVGGGLESISLTQNEKMNFHRAFDPWLQQHLPALYMTHAGDRRDRLRALPDPARQAGRIFAAVRRCAPPPAQQAGRFDDEIVPLPTTMKVQDKQTKAVSDVAVTLDKDEGNRPTTTLEGLAALEPVFKGGQQVKLGKFITAGNASQLSDGASACVLMEEKEAEKRGLNRSASIAAWRWQDAIPTRWASARCSRCRNC